MKVVYNNYTYNIEIVIVLIIDTLAKYSMVQFFKKLSSNNKIYIACTLFFLLICVFNICIVVNADDTVESELPSDDEMEGINKIVKDTEVMKMIQNQADAHERSLKELHHNIDDQLQTIHDHFEIVVDTFWIRQVSSFISTFVGENNIFHSNFKSSFHCST